MIVISTITAPTRVAVLKSYFGVRQCMRIAKVYTCLIVFAILDISTSLSSLELKPISPVDVNKKHTRTLSVKKIGSTNMVDTRHVVSYEDMLKVINQPEKVIIDVRNPDEVKSTGKIPSSINIPLGTVHDALTSMSDEEFKSHYQRSKPSASDELIFYCQSGRRSTEALDKALKLGYSNSKTYLGSWNDWSSRQK